MILIYGIVFLAEYSVNMGYTTTTIYVKNTFGFPTSKQE